MNRGVLLVKVPYNGRAVFFRITAIDYEVNAIDVRLERFTLFWQQSDIHIHPGAQLQRAHHAHFEGGPCATGAKIVRILDPEKGTLFVSLGPL